MFFPEHLIFGCKDNNNSSNESNNLCKKRKILYFYFDFSLFGGTVGKEMAHVEPSETKI